MKSVEEVEMPEIGFEGSRVSRGVEFEASKQAKAGQRAIEDGGDGWSE